MSLYAICYTNSFTLSNGEKHTTSSTYLTEALDPDDAFHIMQCKFGEWWPRRKRGEQPVITDVHPATLPEFWDVLNNFDWYYMMSDDGSVYRGGERAYQRIVAMATAGGPEFEALFEKFREHKFSGEPWATPSAPRPDRPSPHATHT